MSNNYLTLATNTFAEYKEKGSKFIAYAYNFEEPEHLKTILDLLKIEHKKASHFCYAYKIGFDTNNQRTNDDGEPSGSAGKPIYNAIVSKNLSDVLIVVVRYFGGTLLGVPGLIHAYKSASLLALELSETKMITSKNNYEVTFEFVNLNELMKIVKQYNLMIIRKIIEHQCTVIIEIKDEIYTEVNLKITTNRNFEIRKL